MTDACLWGEVSTQKRAIGIIQYWSVGPMPDILRTKAFRERRKRNSETRRYHDTMNLDQRIADLMGAKPLRFQAARGGYTTAHRGVVSFDNGQAAFVKAATDEMTAAWLRTEHAVYGHLGTTPGADFLPNVLAWGDDGSRPILILEDLSGAHWPPPWEPGLVERVQEVLSRLRRAPPMPEMASLESYRGDLCGWRKVAEDPTPFLSLGLCSPSWLDPALPTLMAAEAGAQLAGDDFLHLDVRSDNLCFTPDRTILVDWNWACVGNGEFDLASWLPSLHSEGGPPPESLLPDAPEMAAALSGFWAARAGLPRLAARQTVLMSQLRAALPWAARALVLGPTQE